MVLCFIILGGIVAVSCFQNYTYISIRILRSLEYK